MYFFTGRRPTEIFNAKLVVVESVCVGMDRFVLLRWYILYSKLLIDYHA